MSRILKICKQCGKEYLGTSRQLFCCEKCQKKWHNDMQSGDFKSQRLSSKLTESICPKCGKKHYRVDSGKWRYCESCEENMIAYGIVDVVSQEHRVSF